MQKPSSTQTSSWPWRQRAQEMRVRAEEIGDAELRKRMLELAESYDKLAAQAEALSKVETSSAHPAEPSSPDHPIG